MKSRIVSFTVAIALILCAVLSLGYILPDRIASAEDDPSTPAAKVTDGIRFVQVAAGYDFAIGLTYDRKLYGWSTKANRDTSNMQSLGDYYTANPTEINVTFRKGPQGNYTWTVPATGDTYHTPRTDDKIKSIAATGTTAAFLTEEGYIYTWGVDKVGTADKRDVDHNEGTPTSYLLLRQTNDTYPWNVPYIINYQYYYAADATAGFTNKSSTEQMIPSGNNKLTSLAAGEFNYIFMFERNYPNNGGLSNNYGNKYHVFVWGSALYNAVNRVPATSFSYVNNMEVQVDSRKVFNTFVATPDATASTGPLSVVAGGYTVGINNTSASGVSSLQLHGKNFITTQGVTAVSGSDNTYTVVNTSNLVTSDAAPAAVDISFGGNTYKAAIAGSAGSNTQDGQLVGQNTEQYYARQAGGYIYNVDAADFIINSKASAADVDNKISTIGVDSEGNPIAALKPARYAVSLGNDIGYGITSAGKLYGWGDNAYGQITPGVNGTNKGDPTAILASVNFKSVAAGKQMSQSTKNARAFYGNTTTLDGTAFVDGVKNQEGYITGALDDDGKIYAWSNGIEAKPLTFMNITGGKKENFAAVYSGYGEILYAVTESGKLVRITKNSAGTDFEQYVYDEFYSLNSQAAPQKINNWNVDKTNKVVFNVPDLAEDATTAQKVSPNLGNATFYVWSAATNGEVDADEQPYVKVNGGAQTAYKPLVTSNRIGDAYRIVGLTATDSAINYLKADDLDTTNYAPKFYFDPKFKEDGTVDYENCPAMTTAQQRNMFTFREVFGANGEGVGIYIEPKQSSKGKEIRIEFYIARYNNYGKYSASGNSTDGFTATDNAIYYDYQQCSITFSIADTPSVVTYSAYLPGEDENSHGKSNIPLLDPNNQYNTHYSLAVQDVSTGVNEFIKFLTGDNSTVNTNFKTAIMTEMKKDKGFPDKGKIADGDLEYYLNADDLKKYNSDKTNENDYVYQFIYTDRDSERIMLINSGSSTSMMSSGAQGVDGKMETITVKIEYLPTEYGINNDNGNLTADGFDAALLKTIATDFDNRYGLYGFEYKTEDGKNYLSFKYDVLTFTATDSSGTIAYEGAASTAASVTGYNTAANSGRAGSSFRSYTLNNNFTFDKDKGYVAQTTYDRNTPTANVTNFAYVYSMPSLRLKSTVKDGANGQAGGTKNTYVETRKDSDRGQEVCDVFVRETLYVGDTATIKLSDYVAKTEKANVISFSFNNKAETTELAKFSGQFADYTGHNMSVVSLTDNTIYVHPTSAGPINFTVEVQRFVDVNKSRIFRDSENRVDEKIYLTFNFNNIIGFNMTKNGQAKTEYDITENITVDLFGEGEGVNNAGNSFIDIVSAKGGASLKNTAAAARAYAALKAGAQIYGISSSEDGKDENVKLFTYTNPQNSTDKTKFTITPKRSGSGTILFSANIYDKSESFILTVNVSAITELGDNNKITIIDDQYITVSELNEALRSANSFNDDVIDGKYRILYDDPTAIQWEDEDGNTGKPPFVDRVVFEGSGDKRTIRLVSSNSTTQQSKTYKMYVRYTNADSNVTKYEDAPSGSIIQIVVPVVCGKIKLQAATGGDLVAAIDCRNAVKDSWWKTEGERLETRVTIDLQYLLNLDKTEAPDKYKIFLVSADSTATEFFQYDKGAGDRSIEITPKMNTPKNFELNVSVYKEGENTTKVLSFEVSIKGILTKLPVMTNDDGIIGYGNIWLYSTAIVFGVLFIIFMIRFIVYMRRRAKQRAIIKRNQELIRLRDRMHGKANAASREQLVKSKLKMEDPKYAKMFNDMRRDKEEESGVALVNSDLAATADKKTKKKKKKGGKKSVAELKAELAAKKAAFAAAQSGNAQPVNPFATDVPMDGGFAAPDGGFADGGGYAEGGGFADGGFADGGFADGGFADGGFADGGAQSIDGSQIIFDASDMGDGNM